MRQILRYLCATVALLALSQGVQAAKMRLHGTLVAEPCIIPPGEETIPLDFGSVIDKQLYHNQRTRSWEFKLHLSNCDQTLSKSVQITFTGVENPALPGLLALDASSQASGIGIGVETENGNPVPLNQLGTHRYPLAAGDNYLRMMAYVQGEPDAITNRTINRGPFSASMTFALTYD
ncbi:type 1 fimbrial protein [Serratia sp. JSRIV001]|uniref:fimbrial protein n=1 Tax=Serratia TaxID=613 RepID=UPI000E0F29FD|nr:MULTISPECIES: fimbrial protein [Serratia]QXN63153.1 type 1 fimbrial protein [Serratia fonticola]RDL14320.1 type 1 fimbria pilin [Serratia fonticola]UAN46837.1 type 1 fimbrial protein [Serratia sp. JSRIV001]